MAKPARRPPASRPPIVKSAIVKPASAKPPSAKPPSAKPTSAKLAVSYARALVTSQLAKVRALCASLPETTERPSHGSPAFLVNDKRAFAYFLDDHHSDGRLALWCAAPDGAQAMLIDSDPAIYFLPPYVARLGWIGVRLDRKAPWPKIAAVLEAAHHTRYKPPRAKPARR
ncbi:MAG: MmcQ/YjbR family DNA-binding protein [Kofleriaceae bacterium]